MEEDATKKNENKFKQWFNRTFKMSLKTSSSDTKSLPTSPTEIEDKEKIFLKYNINPKALSMKALTFHNNHSGLNEAPKFIGLLNTEYHIMPIQNKKISSDHEMLIVFEPILLYCYVQSTAQDVVFIWQKNSIEIQPSDRIDILSQETATQLRINYPNISDNGDYDCIAMNPEGSCSTHTHVFVELQEQDEMAINSILPCHTLENNENLNNIQSDSNKFDNDLISINSLENPYRYQSSFRRISFRRTVCYSRSLSDTKKSDTSKKIEELFVKFNSLSECKNANLSIDKHIGSQRNNAGLKYNSFRYLRSYDMNQANNGKQLVTNNKHSDNNNTEINIQDSLPVEDKIDSHYSYSVKPIDNPFLKINHANLLYKDENTPIEHGTIKPNTCKRRYQSSGLLTNNGYSEFTDYVQSYYQEHKHEEEKLNNSNDKRSRLRNRQSYATDTICSIRNNNHWKLLSKNLYNRLGKLSASNLQRTGSSVTSKSSTATNEKSIKEMLFRSNHFNVPQLSATGSSISDMVLLSGFQSPISKSSQVSLNDIDIYPINNMKLIQVHLMNTSNKENKTNSISNFVQEIVMQYVGASQSCHSSFNQDENYGYGSVHIDDSNNLDQIQKLDGDIKHKSNEHNSSTEQIDKTPDSNKDNIEMKCIVSSDKNKNALDMQKQRSFNVSDCDESENQSVIDCSKLIHNQVNANNYCLDTSVCKDSKADKIYFSKNSLHHDHKNNILHDKLNGCISEKSAQFSENLPVKQPPPHEPIKRRPNISSILVDKKLKSLQDDIKINSLASSSEKTITDELPTESCKRKTSEQYQYTEKVRRLTKTRKYLKEQYRPSDRESKPLTREVTDNCDELIVTSNDTARNITSRSNTVTQMSHGGSICNSQKNNNTNYYDKDDNIHHDFHELNHIHQRKIYEIMQKFQIPSKNACLSPSKQVINRIPRLNNENSTKADDMTDKAFYSTIGLDNMVTNQILNNPGKSCIHSKTSSSSSSSSASSIPPQRLQQMSGVGHFPITSSANSYVETNGNHYRNQLEQPVQTSSQCTEYQYTTKHGDNITHAVMNGQAMGITKSASTVTPTTISTNDSINSSKPHLRKYSAYTREEVNEIQCKVIKREAYVHQRKITIGDKTLALTSETSENAFVCQKSINQNVLPMDVSPAKPTESPKKQSLIFNRSISDHSPVNQVNVKGSLITKQDQNELIEYPLKISTHKNINPTDHYEEIGVLGYGTYGHVIKCLEKKTGNIFAAKKFKILRLKRYKGELMEVAVLRAVGKHPQIAYLHAAYEYNIYCTLITEYVPGGALYNRIEAEGSLDEAITVSIIRQILLGLKHLQDCSVIHRDLKPENLMMVQATGYRLKIIDFGLAVFYQSSQCTPIPAGTLTYIAPETQNCDPQSYTTDLWSVAVIAYEILAGITPFEIPQDGCRDRVLTNQEISLNITHVRYDFDDPGIVDVSNEAKDFIKQILVRDPNKRPSVHQCLNHPWMAMREEDRPLVKRTVSLFRHSTRRKPKGYRIKTQTQKCDPHNSADPIAIRRNI
ncbi:Myosin light chain kinase, smooth muscle [Schistosoma japonicum]|uniref:Myosin light chain kinase, smooth muscle n=1 Tax=Schistosoma japonicum TaxID=6182 RepID=A0A4Z2D0T5_SCHJA|nr:Myosin light chain kinase, smooth muscle [Schistosoma japonicum]